MNFLDIIKPSILHTIQSLKFVDIYIGEVIEEDSLKIKLDEKLFITENEIVRTSRFNGNIKRGTNLLILRESGGQRFFIIDTILDNEDIRRENVTY
ncbi:DUF2577 family protein [[Clostridium] colinum]|uniref:DUF2577 family protein n=1 Tax=[Clostridium] colinum TaxID=36835 RepID=UPI002024E247|nr:DUF2577 family protein [[Clostridium] colinum]